MLPVHRVETVVRHIAGVARAFVSIPSANGEAFHLLDHGHIVSTFFLEDLEVTLSGGPVCAQLDLVWRSIVVCLGESLSRLAQTLVGECFAVIVDVGFECSPVEVEVRIAFTLLARCLLAPIPDASHC